MIDLSNKDYVVIVQCDLVKERCSGYQCEKALNERTGGFANYPKNKSYRSLYLSCGGCCGRALHRKLLGLVKTIKKKEEIERDRIVVQLSSCITRDNFHGPPCPHLDYLKVLLEKLGLDYLEDTSISEKAEKHRQSGRYAS